MATNLAEALAAAFQQAITAAVAAAVHTPSVQIPASTEPIQRPIHAPMSSAASLDPATATTVAVPRTTDASTILASATDSIAQCIGLDEVPDDQLNVGELDRYLHHKEKKRKRPRPVAENQGEQTSNDDAGSLAKVGKSLGAKSALSNIDGGQRSTFYPTDSIKMVKHRKMIFRKWSFAIVLKDKREVTAHESELDARLILELLKEKPSKDGHPLFSARQLQDFLEGKPRGNKEKSKSRTDYYDDPEFFPTKTEQRAQQSEKSVSKFLRPCTLSTLLGYRRLLVMLLNRINAEIAAEREHIKGLNEEARQKAAEKLEKQSNRTGAANTQKKQTFQHRDQLPLDFVKATIPPLALRIKKKKKTNINTDPVTTVNDASATAVSLSTTK